MTTRSASSYPSTPCPTTTPSARRSASAARISAVADDCHPPEPVAGTHHARQAGTSAARPYSPAHTAPAPARARRRRVVTATGAVAGSTGLLGISLSTKAGSPQFYLLTMGLAGTSAATGALSSGPLPLDTPPGHDSDRRHPVVMPVLTSARRLPGSSTAPRDSPGTSPRSTGPSAAFCRHERRIRRKTPRRSPLPPHRTTSRSRRSSHPASKRRESRRAAVPREPRSCRPSSHHASGARTRPTTNLLNRGIPPQPRRPATPRKAVPGTSPVPRGYVRATTAAPSLARNTPFGRPRFT